MPTTKVGEHRLYYEIHGQGEPLILVPGFRTGLWLWFRQVETFAQNFRTIIFDPRGIGKSDQSASPQTVRAMADDLAGLLSALEIEQAHVLGASFGGFVAQEFALAYPQRTRSLILCCTSFGGPRHLLPPLHILQAMAANEGMNMEEPALQNFLMVFSSKFSQEDPEALAEVVRLRLSNPVSDQTHFAQLQAAAAFNVETRVAEIEAPVLVLTGDEDTLVPPANSENLVAKIPQAKLSVIAGGSHMFFIEQPEEFNREVISFIDSIRTS
ncbi:MAG: alpha/beta hydrolase fold [Acidobacteria bacterium]|nr:alpha/beta hydrolase fold [Acidobacteriota bacterium]